jgi:hypothetical protein
VPFNEKQKKETAALHGPFAAALGPRFTCFARTKAQCTCFASTKVQTLTQEVRAAALGPRFTCFTSKKKSTNAD